MVVQQIYWHGKQFHLTSSILYILSMNIHVLTNTAPCLTGNGATDHLNEAAVGQTLVQS